MELSACQKRRIQKRAQEFARKWSSKKGLKESKDSEAFIDEFFAIFGIDRSGRNIVFEYELNCSGRIDVFWPGVILIENKSPGLSLSEAILQAKNYYKYLEDYLRPKYILVNNFDYFEIYIFERRQGEKLDSWCRQNRFSLNELPENIDLFHYFFDHKHKTTRMLWIYQLIKKLIGIDIKRFTRKVRFGILGKTWEIGCYN